MVHFKGTGLLDTPTTTTTTTSTTTRDLHSTSTSTARRSTQSPTSTRTRTDTSTSDFEYRWDEKMAPAAHLRHDHHHTLTRPQTHRTLSQITVSKLFPLRRLLLCSLLVSLLTYSLLFVDNGSLYPHVITTWHKGPSSTSSLSTSSSSSASVLTGAQLQELQQLSQASEDTIDPLILAKQVSDLLAPPSVQGSTSHQTDPSSTTSDSTGDTFIDYSQNYGADDLRTRLAKKFPYIRSTQIPKIIWQIWKEPLSEMKNTEIRKYMQSWAEQSNDGYEHRVITDELLELVVQELYAEFPEIMDTFKMLPMDILRFDFLRYLILYALGGTYADADTLSMKPLKEWADTPDEFHDFFPALSSQQQEQVGFFIGIEGDYDRPNWRFKTSRRVQFCQWTFKSKPGHPILRELIHKITQTTLQNYNERLNHVKIGKEYYTLNSIYTVLEWTGPALFTDVIFTHFNKLFTIVSSVAPSTPTLEITGIHQETPSMVKNREFEEYHKPKNGITPKKRVGWSNFTMLEGPAIFDDVLIMPISSFNGFVDDDSRALKIDEDLIYLKHEFHGTWKDL